MNEDNTLRLHALLDLMIFNGRAKSKMVSWHSYIAVSLWKLHCYSRNFVRNTYCYLQRNPQQPFFTDLFSVRGRAMIFFLVLTLYHHLWYFLSLKRKCCECNTDNNNNNTRIQCDRFLLEEVATSRSFTGYIIRLYYNNKIGNAGNRSVVSPCYAGVSTTRDEKV